MLAPEPGSGAFFYAANLLCGSSGLFRLELLVEAHDDVPGLLGGFNELHEFDADDHALRAGNKDGECYG